MHLLEDNSRFLGYYLGAESPIRSSDHEVVCLRSLREKGFRMRT